MIGSLRGEIIEKSIDWMILEVNGVGYRIRISSTVSSDLSGKQNAFLYIHDHVREDQRDLFGFLHLSDLELFEKLLSISGVGPKAALTILSTGSADQVQTAIMAGNLSFLTSVPGVGTKTAQKIILELKGQLVSKEDESSADQEVAQALIGLGYSASQAKEVCKHIPDSITDPSDKVRYALKLLVK
ncbi:MAG: Holliday junction branch migration protein RuvA [Candidatus Magasanikbacteria bacterium]|nr:Holliday junction branch migration protein RuvA [Candidatus Magasanikbacteria bacterium]MCA9389473.1 Holliday junction branch migration protein RuvA [Candidatus Magasanikbacteria bacterium]MCA9390680.1 Holliday junction branch migration protein RuvA [Candidatus Magasanikbacteria bacterium]USN52340.1 MAG: Holliday junction branch migration protein RuvA [Candidatus Nomurabacteria bacterium]